MLGFTKTAYFTTQLKSLLFHYVESKFDKFLSLRDLEKFYTQLSVPSGAAEGFREGEV